ncbi:MAG: ATP-binding cassette domain-containing protein, partial [Alphaproteobacteria bacterium]|nr:ATP-binding cassette domain-containing protein [Alphaproteobacteria bacterium]
FDPHRDQSALQNTLWQSLWPEGGVSVFVAEKPRHVVAFLKDFLFDANQAHTPVKALSGGESNRLLLAKILAQPSDVLIMDEPTNDLDMDTLDMLQEMVADYAGTVILVSHDRDFLNRTVGRIIACEGKGIVMEYVGGYDDYVQQSKQWRKQQESQLAAPTGKASKTPATVSASKTKVKLSYKQQRAYDLLPQRIAEIEQQIASLENELSDAVLYSNNPERFKKATNELEAAHADLMKTEEEWLEIAMLAEAIQNEA